MQVPKLEEVFKLSGVPTYTFVRPLEYTKLLVALRTPGRGVVIEGPSGIGKTSAVTRALEELKLAERVLKLSARKEDDRDIIAELPRETNVGTVIIDDFHRLDESIRRKLADHLKTLADEERIDVKLIIVGINKAGQSLVSFSSDLGYRIDTIPFEVNPDERVNELVTKGEEALNIEINTKDEIVSAAHGSFYLAQMLSHETCLASGVIEASIEPLKVTTSFELTRERVLDNLTVKFTDLAVRFASGPKLRREGRAPYLHILKWLSEANEWSVPLDRELVTHPVHRGSVGQVLDKGYLEKFLAATPAFGEVLHYEPSTRVMTVEDPQFVFFLRNLVWSKFAQRVGYLNMEFPSRYDFALSFAGSDRTVAEGLFQRLCELELEVFYDKNEQHRIAAENVEEYLGPIYRSEAAYVICLLGPDFPKRIWTKFESDQFKNRFGKNAVIPVWFTTVPPGMFDESTRVGGFTFDPAKDADTQLDEISDSLRRKLGETRLAGTSGR